MWWFYYQRLVCEIKLDTVYTLKLIANFFLRKEVILINLSVIRDPCLFVYVQLLNEMSMITTQINTEQDILNEFV